MCTDVIYCEALRLPAILSPLPFSSGYISTAEANLVSIHNLKVHSVHFSSAECLNGQSSDMQ